MGFAQKQIEGCGKLGESLSCRKVEDLMNCAVLMGARRLSFLFFVVSCGCWDYGDAFRVDPNS